MLATIGSINKLLTRPFRQPVDMGTVLLLFALLLVAAGAWHMVLDRLELERIE